MCSLKYNLTVGELAREAEVSPETIRYYLRIGLLNPKRNGKNGYNQFQPKEIGRVRFIRKAKALGYTLKEISEIVSHANDGNSPCPLVRTIIERRIEENRKKLNELTKLQSRMEQAASDWSKRPDKKPDGDSICHLIESFINE